MPADWNKAEHRRGIVALQQQQRQPFLVRHERLVEPAKQVRKSVGAKFSGSATVSSSMKNPGSWTT